MEKEEATTALCRMNLAMHGLEGDIKQAQIFAKRSQVGLRNGSPEWIRAGDIVNYKIPT